MNYRSFQILTTVSAALFLAACAASKAPSVATSPALSANEPSSVEETQGEATPASVVTSADRTEADRSLDPGRHPQETLELLGLGSGNRVADLMAGTGYTAELLARAVGKTGTVYGQNNEFILERYARQPWAERLAKPVNANIVRLDRELDDPLGDVTGLDAVSMVLFYHDTVWMKADRAAMNASIFRALRSGGVYLVIDHAAKEGAGVEDVKTLHRIEASVVLAEVKAAGFELVETAEFLANSADAHDWNAAPSAAGERRGQSDRFVMKFVKP